LIAIVLIRHSSHSDNPGLLFIFCAIGFCLGILTFYRGFKMLQRRRLILDTPFSKIRSASMGMVEVSGQAVGPYTMISPITARPCYYYRTLVHELQQRGKNQQWVLVAGESMFVPFFVDDNTGRFLVDPRGADLDLHRDFQQEFSNSLFTTLNPAPGNVTAFLARKGVSTHRKLKVEECCVKPKNALFILGTLAENPGLEVTAQPIQNTEALSGIASKSFSLSLGSISVSSSSAENDIDQARFAQYIENNSSPATRQQLIRLSTQPVPAKAADMTQQQKVAAALMKAGISNPASWAAAGLAAPQVQVIADPSFADPSFVDPSFADPSFAKPSPKLSDAIGGNAAGNGGPNSMAHGSSVEAASSHATEFNPHPPVVLMKGSNNTTFLISWRSQQEVARALEWKCTLMIWGGPILALASLYLFFSATHLL
jgi:hypothetical protein